MKKRSSNDLGDNDTAHAGDEQQSNSYFHQRGGMGLSGAGGHAAVGGAKSAPVTRDPFEHIIEMREYDVTYTMRAAIDLELRIGSWYDVTPVVGSEICEVKIKKDMLELCDLRVLAFDIECEKAPLKFPDASRDRIYMISYMISGQGYLLINRWVCGISVFVTRHILQALTIQSLLTTLYYCLLVAYQISHPFTNDFFPLFPPQRNRV